MLQENKENNIFNMDAAVNAKENLAAANLFYQWTGRLKWT